MKKENTVAKQLRALAIACLSSEHHHRKAIAQEANNLLRRAKLPELPCNLATLSRFFGPARMGKLNSSAKIMKGKKRGVDSFILYLAAAKNAGINICKYSTPDCVRLCLMESGRAHIESGMELSQQKIHIARIVKTWIWCFAPDYARHWINLEIARDKAKAEKAGRRFCVRLNGTSDLDFTETIETWPGVPFYDYSKRPFDSLGLDRLPNYSICYSFANFAPARMREYCKALRAGCNLAIPVIAADFDQILDLPYCFNADRDDLRHLDREKSSFAILKVKRTRNLRDGNGSFVLSFAQVTELRAQLEKMGAFPA